MTLEELLNVLETKKFISIRYTTDYLVDNDNRIIEGDLNYIREQKIPPFVKNAKVVKILHDFKNRENFKLIPNTKTEYWKDTIFVLVE